MRGDGPDVTKWHLRGYHCGRRRIYSVIPSDFAPFCDGFFESPIDIFDVQQNADRRSTHRLRAVRTHLGKFVRQHDDRVANTNFGMHDFAARTFHFEAFVVAKRLSL